MTQGTTVTDPSSFVGSVMLFLEPTYIVYILRGKALGSAIKKASLYLESGLSNMAPQPGLEPGTQGLTVLCSTN